MVTMGAERHDLSWIAQVAFCEDILEEGASVFWLPVLRYLAEGRAVDTVELHDDIDIPKRVVEQVLTELGFADLVETTDGGRLVISAIGRQAVERIDTMEQEFLGKLRNWLTSHLQDVDEVTDEDLHRFLHLLAAWGEDEAQVFSRLVGNGKPIPNERPLERPAKVVEGDLPMRMRRLIVKLRQNRINDQFAKTLTLHSFVYWVVLQAFKQGPATQLRRLLREKKKVLILDTNVLLGLVVPTDRWHQVSRDLLQAVMDSNEKGASLELVLLATTIDEFRYTVKKVGSRLRSIRHAKDEETVKALARQTENMGLFLEFFDKVYAWGHDYTRYRDHLYVCLGMLIDRAGITVLGDSDLEDELVEVEKHLPALRRFEEKRFGYADDDRIRHKLAILALVAVKRREEDVVPLVWTFNRRFRRYEEVALGSRAHCVDTLRLQAIIRDEDLFDRGAVGALRRVIEDAYVRGVGAERLKDLRNRALQYYRHYVDLRLGRTVSGQARERRVTMRDQMLREIARLSRGGRRASVFRDGLDFVFETE